MARYYFTSLANRPMTLSGKVFKFTICGLSSGRACGVYKTEDPGEIAVLDDAVRGRRGVKEIGEAEYIESEKKTAQIRSSLSLKGYAPRVVQPPILPALAVEAVPGVPAEMRPSAPQKGDIFSGPGGKPMSEAERNRPSIANLLRVGKVNPPKPFAASEGKVRKAAARADRAKIRVVRPAENT